MKLDLPLPQSPSRAIDKGGLVLRAASILAMLRTSSVIPSKSSALSKSLTTSDCRSRSEVSMSAAPISSTRRSPGSSADEELVSGAGRAARSEEHTSELQSRQYLVCRLLLEKKNNK